MSPRASSSRLPISDQQPVADLNAFQDQLCLLLASLHENQRLQVQYFCDSDYKGELLRYQQETERFTNVWTKRARNERFTRYWQAMSERKLRRQRVMLYISRALENVRRRRSKPPPPGATTTPTLLDQLQTEFEHVHRLLSKSSRRLGRASCPCRISTISGLQALPESVAQRPFRLRSGGRLSPELSFRRIAGTARATGSRISASSSMVITTRSSS
jgi:hypothetical protein